MKKLLVILTLFSVFLVGCLGGVRNEKQAFIDATVEATCLVFQSDNIFDPALEEKAKAIFEKHGFDADDEEAMNVLTDKYEDDEDVQAAITNALEECAGDFADVFGDMEGLDEDLDEELDEALEELDEVLEELDEVPVE
jgi:hypothetical protein